MNLIRALRRKINDINRIRRKGLNKLHPPLIEHKDLIKLSAKRPVNIDGIIARIVKQRKSVENFDASLLSCVEDLLEKEIWASEGKNLLLSILRSLRNTDPEKAISIGEDYVSRINDDRILKTLVQLYLKVSDNNNAIKTMELIADSAWVNDKLMKLRLAESKPQIESEIFESRVGVIAPFDRLGPTICIYADVDSNIIDGSSIWLSSVAEAFCHDGFNVHVLLKKNIERDVVVAPLLKRSQIKLLEPKLFGILEGQLEPKKAIELIQYLDGYFGGYSRVLLRGFELCKIASSTKSLHLRIWAYLTDYYQINGTDRDIKKGVEEYIHEFIYCFDKFLLQTELIKKEFIERFSVPESKISLLPPMIPKIEPVNTKKIRKTINIGYAGKIAPLWGVLELIEVSRRLITDGYDVKVHIVGDKIHRNTPEHPDFLESTREKLNNTYFVNWYGGKSREDSIDLMKEMDICWAYRSKILEQNTLELSTKLLELMSIGNPIILTKNVVHSNLMGSEYPYFVSDKDELLDTMKEIIADIKSGSELMEKVIKSAEDYTIPNAKLIRINPLLKDIKHAHASVSKKIVINGHDLKFVAEYESYLKKLGHEVRRDHWGWGDPLNLERSKALADWGDIIFSEWGLANAVWYSENISEDKRHIIRIHLQEINQRARKFPPQINLHYVSKIVFIAEHVRNTAIEMFDWPIEKTMTISNYVDVDKFRMSKSEEAGRTMAIVGIVPQRKRLDRAIDLLIALRKTDQTWRLIVKGNLPHDYAFMHAPGRSKELEYYDTQYERIKTNGLEDFVLFEGYTPSLPYWYRKVGYIISSSDFESFHYSIAEGVSSGSIPLIWKWEGSEDLYPKDWSREGTEEIAEFINQIKDNSNFDESENRVYIEQNYGMMKILNQLHLETTGVNVDG